MRDTTRTACQGPPDVIVQVAYNYLLTADQTDVRVE